MRQRGNAKSGCLATLRANCHGVQRRPKSSTWSDVAPIVDTCIDLSSSDCIDFFDLDCLSVTMRRQTIDLLTNPENEVLSDPLAFAPRIQCVAHEKNFEQIAQFFPGLKRESLPEAEGWEVEVVQLSAHCGAYPDAPNRVGSTMDVALGESRSAMAIHDVPREWCFHPGVKLDFRHFRDGYVVTASDVEAELNRIHYEIKPLDIVVVNTRAGSRYGFHDYATAGCCMSYEATTYLLERGVRLTGTDAWNWDAPLEQIERKYLEANSPSLLREGYKAGRDIGYCRIEKMRNLASLPAHGFFISCFPHKVHGASAGWTRAVAILDHAQTAMAD